MPKKIGIVTFHHASSYGAVLQTYALQNFMFNLNIDNKVVNYRCKFIEDRARVFKYIKGKSLRNYAYSLKNAKSITLSRKNSETFGKKFLKITKPYYKDSISQCADDFDAFVAGSDQVWSPVCVGFDPTYFLNFAKEGQRFSYAASFGTTTLPENKLDEYKKRLSVFDKISVREESGKEIVSNLIGKEAFIHVDPTLLLKKEQWDKLAAANEQTEPYIFLFTVLKPKNLVNYAVELAEKTGMKIIYPCKGKKTRNSHIEYIKPVTADKFISLIKNAAYVCTNSFHGNAFSLIYHKNFIVETDTATVENNRSKELMKKLGLKNRILAKGLSPDIDFKTDWESVDKYFELERKNSAEYLLSIAK